MSSVQNLDEVCPFDGRTVGEHTMREWAEHVDREGVDLPYEEIPAGPVMAGLDMPLADNVVARSAFYDARSGPLKVVMPVMALDFSIGIPGAPPRPVTSVAVLAPADTMRKLGKLLRDTAFGAANAAERVR